MFSQRELKKLPELNFAISQKQVVAGRKSRKSREISLATINSRDIFFQLLIFPLKYIAMATIKKLDGLIIKSDTGKATNR